MDPKIIIIDALDPRPIPKVTLYAFGTLLQGIAIGLLVPVMLPVLNWKIRLVLAALSFMVGAAIAVSAYSVLKRKYRIVPKR